MEGGKEAENTRRIKIFVTVTCKIANFDKCHEGKGEFCSVPANIMTVIAKPVFLTTKAALPLWTVSW